MKILTTTICLTAALVLNGCTSEAPDSTAQGPSKPVEKASGLPADLMLASAPDDEVGALGATKSAAAIGDEVIFEGRIGGSVDPFVADRAMFLIADSSLLICSEIHGDTCKTPWDYCCEPRDSLLANTATVQVVGDDGKPIKVSLRGEHGLVETATVVVKGIVSAKDEAGTFVVDATSLYVREG